MMTDKEFLSHCVRKEDYISRMIFACDRYGTIGYDGDLIFKGNQEDMEYFRRLTIDNVVLMGHGTFKSLGCKPLSHRTNIVFSHSPKDVLEEFRSVNCVPYVRVNRDDYSMVRYDSPNTKLVIVNDFRTAVYYMKKLQCPKEFWVIGGASMYDAFYPVSRTKVITFYDYNVADNDFAGFLPEGFDKDKLVTIPGFQDKWEKEQSKSVNAQGTIEHNGHTVRWVTYTCANNIGHHRAVN